jgi:hypothetical protein
MEALIKHQRSQRNALIEMMDMREGWVLVFDMDQTITGNYFDVDEAEEELELNPKIVEVLKIALEDKGKGGVSAIFLLTNNSDTKFINHMEKKLEEAVGKGKIFDYKMDANHPMRTHEPHFQNIQNGKRKTLADVEYMLLTCAKTTKNLPQRLLFFDDQEHILSLQLKSAGRPEHFVHVNPPFIGTRIPENKSSRRGTRKHTRTPHRVVS